MAALVMEDLSKSELKMFCDSGFIPCTSSGVLLDQDQGGHARTPGYGTPRIYDVDGTIPQNNHTPIYNHGTPGGTPSYGTPNHYETPNHYGTPNYGGAAGRQTPIGYDRPRPERRSTIGTPHIKPGPSRTPERPGRTPDYSSNDYNYPRTSRNVRMLQDHQTKMIGIIDRMGKEMKGELLIEKNLQIEEELQTDPGLPHQLGPGLQMTTSSKPGRKVGEREQDCPSQIAKLTEMIVLIED